MIYEDVVSVAVEALLEELTLVDDGATLYRLQRLLLDQRTNARLYYLSPASVVQNLWPTLRNDDDLTHLIMSASIAFNLRLVTTYGDQQYQKFCEALAESISGLVNNEIADTTFREQISKKTSLLSCLHGNSWLVFLIVLERNISQLRHNGLFGPIGGDNSAKDG